MITLHQNRVAMRTKLCYKFTHIPDGTFDTRLCHMAKQATVIGGSLDDCVRAFNVKNENRLIIEAELLHTDEVVMSKNLGDD